jgi:Tfp pilus assembly protein PilN
VPGDAFSAADAEPVSFWKKEISLTDLLRKPGAEPAPGKSPDIAPGKAKDTQSGGKKKRGTITLPKLGGSPFGKSRGSRRGSPNTPVAVPLTRAVNLLPPDLATQRKGAIGPAEIGVGVAAVAIVAGLFVLFTSASSKVSDAEQALQTVQAEQEALAQSAAELIAAAGGGTVASPLLGEEGERASVLSTALESRTAWDRVLRRVTVVMPADTWLRGLGGTSTTSDLALNAGPGADLVSTLTLTGYSLNRDGVAKLLSRMETIPDLASVQLLAATQTQLNGSTVVEYSITATLKDDAAAAPQATTIGTTP